MAHQLMPQLQFIALALPGKALQQSMAPEPAFGAVAAVIPAPLHHGAMAETMAGKRTLQVPADLGRAQAVTALPFQQWRHRLIQNPGTEALQSSSPGRKRSLWGWVALLHRGCAVDPR